MNKEGKGWEGNKKEFLVLSKMFEHSMFNQSNQTCTTVHTTICEELYFYWTKTCSNCTKISMSMVKKLHSPRPKANTISTRSQSGD